MSGYWEAEVVCSDFSVMTSSLSASVNNVCIRWFKIMDYRISFQGVYLKNPLSYSQIFFLE